VIGVHIRTIVYLRRKIFLTRAFKCNKCKELKEGNSAIVYDFNIHVMGSDPNGDLCHECSDDFIVWLKNANS